jgi:lipopolysaccharide/colanic/teichoic acid biosynthesis glycosyltransferase
VRAVYSHINSLSNSATDACREEGLKLTRSVSGGLAMRRIVLLLVDLSLIALATVCALVLRDNLAPSIARLHHLLPYLAASLVAALVVLPAFGLNRAIWRFSTLWDYLRIVGASILIVLSAVGIGFAFNRLEDIARALPVLQGILIVAFLVSVRVMMRLRHDVRKPKSTFALNNNSGNLGTTETVLIIGLNSITELFLQSVTELAENRIKVAGLLGSTDRHSGRILRQYEILGTADQLENVLSDLEVHGVFVNRIVVTPAFDKLSLPAQDALLRVERATTIRVDFFAERIGFHEQRDKAPIIPTAHKRVADDGNLRSISVDLVPALRRPYWRIKRALDITGAACLIVLLAPLMGLLAVVVAIDVGLPAIFWQQRPGLLGRSLRLLKFRSMAGAHDDYGRPVKDELRSSAVGRFLRRSRLDELPQLFNILSGDMSFVGPRPLLPVDQSREHNYRLLARPGLTGWAQVNGGRNISAEDKSALDVWYIKNASLELDLKISWLTFATIMGGERSNGSAVRQARQELGIERPTEALDFETHVAHSGRAVA